MVQLLFSSGVMAQQSISLTNIDFKDLPSGGIEVRLNFDAKPPMPVGFSLDNPARISLDLLAVVSELQEQRYNVEAQAVDSVMVLDDGSKTRLIFNMDRLQAYEVIAENNDLLIRIGAGSQAAQTISRATTSRLAAQQENSLTDISFSRGDNDEGLLSVTLSNERIVASVERLGSRVYIEFDATQVPEDLNRRFDVSDFATSVTAVDVLAQASRATIVIDVEGEFEYVAYRSGDVYTVTVIPPSQSSPVNDSISNYTGAVTGLSFQDISVRSVLQILADYYDFNLITPASVSGNITIEMDDVPWDQALELVLRTHNLDSRLEGNVLYVAPAIELAAQDQAALEARQKAQQLAPLLTEYVQVNYADASRVMALLVGEDSSSVNSADVTGLDSKGILSVRGTAMVDERTNIIIVRDTQDRLEQVRLMLLKLDVPVRQVSIEARIVNVSTSSGRDLGIRWGGAGRGNNFRYGGAQATTLELSNNQAAREVAMQNAVVAGEAARIQALQDGTDPGLIQSLVNLAIASVPIPLGSISFPDALAVDLGVDSAESSSFSLGYSGSDGLIELELSALENSGYGEVIARPKVTTQDKVTAVIESGVRIPYQAQAGGTAGGSTTEFEEALLSLRVTPHITPDGRINMKLEIQQDSVAPGSGAIPAINTNSISTSALVEDGGTIVLGGVFREEVTRFESKTPILGDLPYLGRLFKRTNNESRRTELLIFITPKIITDLKFR
ncbi:MAG: type IV pilus secretin PilQ [SAR86 cluster bacterium]|uniref:Type IV pilus secretin PilQ n=1 Tax=SAR86 cluster bacterium TaxID=2030880 RepID=A0A2A4MML1_9GAMM|nr:MAG: type IV pilus secretin PilQ [SAR86 cluster bacterium]